MADLESGEHLSETRELTQGEVRAAGGGGPPWFVVVLLVIAIAAIVGYVIRS
ncbi:MAG: hypothetical protein IPL61_02980 [Myxococcales bacterium]|nr:hypothetical protein [Myxococcales bacterium]